MNKDITFCSKEGNKCSLRFKCYRYTEKHAEDEYIWYADFHKEGQGKHCEYFIDNRKEEI